MRGIICGFEITIGSGIALVCFEDGARVPVESGHGLRAFARAFGSLEAAVGEIIEYKVDEIGVMEAFEVVEIP